MTQFGILAFSPRYLERLVSYHLLYIALLPGLTLSFSQFLVSPSLPLSGLTHPSPWAHPLSLFICSPSLYPSPWDQPLSSSPESLPLSLPGITLSLFLGSPSPSSWAHSLPLPGFTPSLFLYLRSTSHRPLSRSLSLLLGSPSPSPSSWAQRLPLSDSPPPSPSPWD